MNESDNVEPEVDDPTDGWSRRSVFKAGIGAGVGLAAWGVGPSISSIGGTPAYALECTFAIERTLADDRNTDQGSSCVNLGGFGYHEVDALENLPTGFRSVPVGWNSKVCSTNADPFELWLYYPADLNLECAVEVEFYLPSAKTVNTYKFSYDQTKFPNSAGPGPDEQPGEQSLYWQLPTAQEVADYATANAGTVYPPESSTRYRIKLRCVTAGHESCFD